MNIIEELYYGNINPTDKSFDRKSVYGQFIKTICDNEEKLTAYLNARPELKEEQQLFAQLINAQSEVQEFSALNRFIEGFQLGARFTLDTFVLPQNSVIRDIT